MSVEDLLFEIRGGIARLTINRPQSMNAMYADMWQDAHDHIRDIEHDPDVRVVLLTGAGENFSAGGDVKEFNSVLGLKTAERARYWMRNADRTNAMFTTLERIPQVFVVSARGFAAGGGLSLVAAADLAIVSETCKMFVAQIKLGAIPDSGAAYNILRAVGPKRAKQLAFLGDTIDAETAREFGLVNWVVPDAELEARTDELCDRLAKMPQVAISRTKAAFQAANRESLADYFVREALDVGACVSDPAYVERVQAFMTRKRPAK